MADHLQHSHEGTLEAGHRTLSVCLIAYFTCFFINVGQQLSIAAFGTSVVPFSLIAFSTIFLLLAFIFALPGNIKLRFSEVALILVAAVLGIYGLLLENPPSIIAFDLWAFSLMFFGLYLGRRSNWEYTLENSSIVMFYVGAALVAAGTQFTRLYLAEIDFVATEDSKRTYQLAYDFLMFIETWPYLLYLSYFSRSVLIKMLSVIGVLLYLGFTVYFEKRAPFARCIITVLVVAFVAQNFRISPTRLFFGLVLSLGVLVLVLPEVEPLLLRFKSVDTSRVDEVGLMFNSFTATDVLVGRGAGGWFYWPGMEEGYVVSELGEGRLGRSMLHIGAAVPLLKGGLLLLGFLSTVIFTRVLNAILSGDRRAKTFAAIAGVWAVFRLTEGGPSPGSPFESLLIFLMLGSLGRRRWKKTS